MLANFLRRFVDLVLSLFGLFILFPFFLLLAVLIRLTSKGPVFYKAKRIGKDGVPFFLYKFRTMVIDADKQGPGITVSGDRRVTSIGKILRQIKVDELPQLINVLKGEMSLVGPRPESPDYVALYTSEQRLILSVRPGITGAASLQYRQEADLLSGENWERRYCEEILPHKIAIDLAYLKERSLFTDIWLIIKTITGIFY